MSSRNKMIEKEEREREREKGEEAQTYLLRDS